MEDKIEVGEYVRINKNSRFLGIGKVIGIVGNTIYLKMYIDLPISFSEEEIKECKYSKNIIDLIEKGDYYNGIPIVHKLKDGRIQLLTGCLLSNEDIKEGNNIVTKEQFENVKYKI